MPWLIKFVLYFALITTMQTDLQKIKDAAEGLWFMSESDHPFQLVQLKDQPASLEKSLLGISGKGENSLIEKQELEYFFRIMTKVYPNSTPEQLKTAQRFQNLQKVLKEVLADIQVYRIGEIQIDAFIVGKLKDGTYAGLRTILIET
jgi:hypothetical protein